MILSAIALSAVGLATVLAVVGVWCWLWLRPSPCPECRGSGRWRSMTCLRCGGAGRVP